MLTDHLKLLGKYYVFQKFSARKSSIADQQQFTILSEVYLGKRCAGKGTSAYNLNRFGNVDRCQISTLE